MGDTLTNSKIVKMKLFAVLAIAVASRQVNFVDGETKIGEVCVAVKDCGANTECVKLGDATDTTCQCVADHEADGLLDCKPAVATIELGKDCDAAPTTCGTSAVCQAPAWLKAIRTAGDICACPEGFVANKDNVNCDAVTPPAIGDACAIDADCTGGNQVCKESAAKASELTCQCAETHENKEGKCEPLTTDGSAAFYSVATAFMALILA